MNPLCAWVVKFPVLNPTVPYKVCRLYRSQRWKVKTLLHACRCFQLTKKCILVASTVCICLGKAAVRLGSRTCERKAGKAMEADKDCWEFRADTTCTACRSQFVCRARAWHQKPTASAEAAGNWDELGACYLWGRWCHLKGTRVSWRGMLAQHLSEAHSCSRDLSASRCL